MGRLRLGRTYAASYKRLHGWEPQTVYRGYDQAGNQVHLAEAWQIITEVEPEWDDEQRTMAQALEDYEAGIGPYGFHHSLTSNIDNFFTVEAEHCNICAEQAKHARFTADEDAKTMARYGDDPPPTARRPTDGRRWFWRQMGALEAMAQRSAASSQKPAH